MRHALRLKMSLTWIFDSSLYPATYPDIVDGFSAIQLRISFNIFVVHSNRSGLGLAWSPWNLSPTHYQGIVPA